MKHNRMLRVQLFYPYDLCFPQIGPGYAAVVHAESIRELPMHYEYGVNER